MVPLSQQMTLDDDISVTCAMENLLETIADRKALREGHTADCVSDEFFYITLEVRFRSLGERKGIAASELLKRFVQFSGEVTRNKMVVTKYRGYGRPVVVDEIKKLGVLFLFVMH